MIIKNENCEIHIPEGWKTRFVLFIISVLHSNKPMIILGKEGQHKQIYIGIEESNHRVDE